MRKLMLLWMTTVCFIDTSILETHASDAVTDQKDHTVKDKYLYRDGIKEKKSSHVKKSDDTYVTQEEFDRAMAEVTAQIDQLNQQMGDVTDSIAILTSSDAKMESNITALEEQIDTINNRHQKVAFTAYNNYDYIVRKGQTLVFRKVYTNYGSGYDKNKGIFTCPVSGLYYFVVTTFTSHKGGRSMVELVRDGRGLMTAFSDYSDEDQGSNSWIFQCDVGGRVWTVLASDDAEISSHFGSYQGQLHSFVGFLVFAD